MGRANVKARSGSKRWLLLAALIAVATAAIGMGVYASSNAWAGTEKPGGGTKIQEGATEVIRSDLMSYKTNDGMYSEFSGDGMSYHAELPPTTASISIEGITPEYSGDGEYVTIPLMNASGVVTDTRVYKQPVYDKDGVEAGNLYALTDSSDTITDDGETKKFTYAGYVFYVGRVPASTLNNLDGEGKWVQGQSTTTPGALDVIEYSTLYRNAITLIDGTTADLEVQRKITLENIFPYEIKKGSYMLVIDATPPAVRDVMDPGSIINGVFNSKDKVNADGTTVTDNDSVNIGSKVTMQLDGYRAGKHLDEDFTTAMVLTDLDTSGYNMNDDPRLYAYEDSSAFGGSKNDVKGYWEYGYTIEDGKPKVIPYTGTLSNNDAKYVYLDNDGNVTTKAQATKSIRFASTQQSRAYPLASGQTEKVLNDPAGLSNYDPAGLNGRGNASLYSEGNPVPGVKYANINAYQELVNGKWVTQDLTKLSIEDLKTASGAYAEYVDSAYWNYSSKAWRSETAILNGGVVTPVYLPNDYLLQTGIIRESGGTAFAPIVVTNTKKNYPEYFNEPTAGDAGYWERKSGFTTAVRASDFSIGWEGFGCGTSFAFGDNDHYIRATTSGLYPNGGEVETTGVLQANGQSGIFKTSDGGDKATNQVYHRLVDGRSQSYTIRAYKDQGYDFMRDENGNPMIKVEYQEEDPVTGVAKGWKTYNIVFNGDKGSSGDPDDPNAWTWKKNNDGSYEFTFLNNQLNKHLDVIFQKTTPSYTVDKVITAINGQEIKASLHTGDILNGEEVIAIADVQLGNGGIINGHRVVPVRRHTLQTGDVIVRTTPTTSGGTAGSGTVMLINEINTPEDPNPGVQVGDKVNGMLVVPDDQTPSEGHEINLKDVKGKLQINDIYSRRVIDGDATYYEDYLIYDWASVQVGDKIRPQGDVDQETLVVDSRFRAKDGDVYLQLQNDGTYKDLLVVNTRTHFAKAGDKLIKKGTTDPITIEPPAVKLGDVISYNVVIRNTGDVDIDDLTITDTLDNGLQFVKADKDPSQSGQVLKWDPITLKARKLTQVNRWESITSNGGEADEKGKATEVGTVQYPLAPEVLGPLEDDRVSYSYDDEYAWTYDNKNSVADPVIYEVNARVVSSAGEEEDYPNQVKNSASATYLGNPNTPPTAEITANLTPDVEVAKQVVKITQADGTEITDADKLKTAAVMPGDTITYEVRALNYGKAPSENAVVTDTLSDDLEFVSATGTHTQDGRTITWNIADTGNGPIAAAKYNGQALPATTTDHSELTPGVGPMKFEVVAKVKEDAGGDGKVGNTAAITDPDDPSDPAPAVSTETPIATKITAKKVWDDNGNQDGKRTNLQLELKTKADGARVTTDADGRAFEDPLNPTAEFTPDVDSPEVTWSYLKANDYTINNTTTTVGDETYVTTKVTPGAVIAYTVDEISQCVTNEDYTKTVSGPTGDANAGFTFTVTNTHEPEKANISVTKDWNDALNQDGLRTEVVLHLYKVTSNGLEAVGDSKRVIPEGATGDALTVTWNDLPVYGEEVDGKVVKLKYVVEEESISGYTAQLKNGQTPVDADHPFELTNGATTALDLTNTHTPEVTSVTVAKEWDDSDDVSGIRPESVEVTLQRKVGDQADPTDAPDYKDAAGKDVSAKQTIVKNAQGEWTYTWENLPVNADGKKITYSVVETKVDGYADPVVTGNAADGFTVRNSLERPNILVKKSTDAQVAKVGENITYTITVTNEGPGVAKKTTVKDTLGAGLEVVSNGTTPEYATAEDGTISWNDQTIEVGEGNAKTYTVVAKVTDAARQSVTNSADASDPADPEDPPTSPVTTPLNPQLKVEKTVTMVDGEAISDQNADKAKVGSAITYEVKVTNDGYADAKDTTVTDTLGDGLTYASSTPEGAQDGSKITWEHVTVAARSSVSYSVSAKVTEGAGAEVANTATASDPQDPYDPDDPNDPKKSTTTTPLVPVLEITKTVDYEQQSVYGYLDYTIVVKNTGKADATDTTITDVYDAALVDVVSLDEPLAIDSGAHTITWPHRVIRAGQQITLHVYATISTDAGENIVNSVTAHDPGVPEDPTDDATTKVLRPDLEIEKVADVENAYVGDTITYTVKVTNQGEGLARNTTVTDQLGDGLEFVSAENIDPTRSDTEAGKLVWTGQRLEAGESKTYTVKAKVTSEAVDAVANNANAQDPADPNDPPTDDVETQVIAPKLAIEKTADTEGPVQYNDTITYTVKVSNVGNGTAKEATVTDTLPAGLTFVSASDGGTIDGNNLITWPTTTIDAGDSVTYTVEARVNDDAADLVKNIAEASDPGDPNSPVDSTVETPVANPNIKIAKSTTATSAKVGDIITYSVVVTNDGDGAARNTLVLDAMGQGLEYVSATGTHEYLAGLNAIQWSGVEIDPHSSKTFTVRARVTDEAGKNVVNTAMASDPGDSTPPEQADVTTPLTPDLEIAKTTETEKTFVGDQVVYTITISNVGKGDANATTVTDTLDTGHKFMRASDGGTNEGNKVTWTGVTIPAGESVTRKVAVEITDAAGESVTNTVMAKDDKDPNDPPTATVTTPMTPKVAIEKTVNVEHAKKGETITYTVTAKNTGKVDTTTATVTDTLGEGLQYVSDDGFSKVEGQVITWNNVAIKAGDSVTFTVKVKVLDTAGDKVVNNAKISDPSDPTDPQDPSKSANTQTPINQTKTVTRTITYTYMTSDGKTASETVTQTVEFEREGTVNPDGTVTYPEWKDVPPKNYNAVNTPNIPGWNPTMETVPGDPVKADAPDSTVTVVYKPNPPEGTDKVTYGGKGQTQTTTPEFKVTTGTTPDGTPNKIEKVELIDPETGEPSATGTVTVPEGTYTMNPDGTVSFTPNDPNYTGDPTPVTMRATDSNGLTVDKTYQPHVKDNIETKDVTRTITYTYLTEDGAEASATVTQTVQFVREATVNSDGSLSWPDWSTIEPQTFESVTSPDIPGWVADRLTVDAKQVKATDDNIVEHVVYNKPDLQIEKTVDKAEALVGDELTYTITVTNTDANLAAAGAKVTDTIPEDLTYVSSDPEAAVEGATLTWSDIDLAAGASVTYAVKATVNDDAPNKVANTAMLTDPYSDDPKESTATTDILRPDLEITKTADLEKAKPGDEITYTITVTNKGKGAATNTVVGDKMNHGLECTYASDNHMISEDKLAVMWVDVTLQPGESKTFTVKARVLDTAKKAVLNEVEAFDLNDPNDPPTAKVSVPLTPDLEVTKTVDCEQTQVREYVTYTVTVRNVGAGDATDTTVTDTYSLGLVNISADDGTVDEAARTITWEHVNIPAGEEVEYMVCADVSAEAGDEITNGVTAHDPEDPNDDPTAEVTTPVVRPALEITKSVDKSAAYVGDELSYTIKVKNTGKGGTIDSTITDQLGEGLEFVSADPTIDPNESKTDEGKMLWTGQVIAAGETAEYHVKAKVTDEAGLTVENTATAFDPDDPNIDPENPPTATATTEVLRPDLEITKTADVDQTTYYGEVEYTITVTNVGNGDAKNTTVTDTLGAGLTYWSSDPEGQAADGKITWSGVSIPVGQSVTYKVLAYVSGKDATQVVNNVTAEDPADPNEPPTAEVKTPVKSPHLEFTKTANVTSAQVGDIITYTITVTNTGEAEAQYVHVLDTLRAGLEFVSADKGGGYVPDVRAVEWPRTTLGVGKSATYTVEARVASEATGKVTNEALAYDPTDPVNEPPAKVEIPLPPELSIEKKVDKAAAYVGDELHYTVSVTNKGATDTSATEVVDKMGEGLEFVSADPEQGEVVNTPTETILVWSDQVIPAGETVECYVVAKTTEAAGDAVGNTATVSDPDDPNIDPENPPTATTTTEILRPDLEITKKANREVAQFDDSMTYTIEVTNKGNGDAKDTTVTDTFKGVGLDYAYSLPKGAYRDGVITWEHVSIPAGETVTFSVTARVNASAAGKVENGAMAQDPADPNEPPTAEVTVPIKNPDLTIEKTADVATAKVGDTITYTVTVKNVGEGNALWTDVEDVLGAGLDFVSATDNGLYRSEDRTIYWVTSLKPSEQKSFTVQARVASEAKDEVVNTAKASDWSDPTPPEPVEVKTPLTVDKPSLAIEKVANVTSAKVGDTIEYTIKVTNNGNVALESTDVMDAMQPNLTYKSSKGPDGSEGATHPEMGLTAVAWSNQTFAIGETKAYTVVAEVKSADAAVATNAARALDESYQVETDCGDMVDVPLVDTKTVTRTVEYKYIDKDGKEVTESVTQTVEFERTGVQDPETGEWTYPDWSTVPAKEFPPVDSPDVDGWTPDQTTVPGTPVSATDDDMTETVVYAPEAPKGTPAESVGGKGQPQTGTPTFEVTTKTTPDGTPNKIEKIELLDENGNPSSMVEVPEGTYKQNPDGTITFTPKDPNYTGTPTPAKVRGTDSNGKTVETTYTPKVIDNVETKTVTRTVEYKYKTPDGREASKTITQTATFERTGTVDPETGEITYPDWSTIEPQTLPAVDSPDIDGWTPDKDSVPELVVKATDDDSTETVVYKSKPPIATSVETYGFKGEPQSGTPTFKIGTPTCDDGTPNEIVKTELIDPETGEPTNEVTIPGEGTYTIDPETGTVTFTPDPDFTGTPTPVKVRGTDKNGDTAEGTYTPHVVDKEQTVTKSRTITYVYEEGGKAADPVEQTATFTRTATGIDPATGEPIWGEWTTVTVDDTTSPTIEGYTPNKDMVPGGEFTDPDQFPGDVEVVYAKVPEPAKKPELKIEKTADVETAKAGDTITYTVKVTNVGEGDATNANVKDLPATCLHYVSSEPAGQPTRDGLVWEHLNIPAGESLEFTVVCTVLDYESKAVNNASVEDPEDPTGPHETSVTTPIVGDEEPHLKIVKKSSLDAAKVGDTIEFDIEVTNDGNVDLADTTVVDSLPGYITYTDSADPNGNRAQKMPIDRAMGLRWTEQSFQVGETKTYKVWGVVISTDSVVATNIATAVDNGYDPLKTFCDTKVDVPLIDTKTVTRTIEYKYIDKDGKEASATVTQEVTFERTGVLNPETGKYEYPDWSTVPAKEFPAAETPKIDGWTPTETVVPAAAVKATDDNMTKLVTYDPQPPVGTPKVSVDAKGKVQTGTPEFKVSTPTTPDGKPNQIESYTLIDPETGKPADKVTVPGEGTYTIDPATGTVTFTPEPDFVGKAKGVTVQATDTNGQKATTTFTPEVKENVETKTVTRTIEYKYKTPDGRTAVKTVTQELQFTREGTFNPETGEVEYPDWSTVPAQEFPEVTAPEIEGWTPMPATTPAATAKATDGDLNEMVIYKSKPPIATSADSYGFKGEAQSGTPTFDIGTKTCDDGTPNEIAKIELIDPATGEPAKDGKVVIPGEGTYTIDPNDPTKVVFTPEPDFVGNPTPVTVRGTDKNGEYADGVYAPHVVESEETVTKSRTITYVYEKDGKQASEPVTQTVTFKRKATGIDPATGQPIWGDWEAVTVDDAASPAIKGYRPDKASVAGGTFGDPNAFPGDEVVEYNKNYVIHFDPNGGTGSMGDQEMEFDSLEGLNKNAFTRDGYEFVGWKDQYGREYKDLQEVMNLIEQGEEVTLYAQWKKVDAPAPEPEPTPTPGKKDEPANPTNPTDQQQTTTKSTTTQQGKVTGSTTPSVSKSATPATATGAKATTSTAKTADGMPWGIPVALVGAAAAALAIARRKLA